jgi:hypothetical protein
MYYYFAGSSISYRIPQSVPVYLMIGFFLKIILPDEKDTISPLRLGSRGDPIFRNISEKRIG